MEQPNMNQCKSALRELALLFQKEKIKWALGGSMLLYFHGLVPKANDIDILIDENQEDLVRDIVSKSEFSVRQPQEKQGCHSRIFIPVVFRSVEIDIIGGFTIQNQYFPLQESEIEKRISLDGVEIPLHSLSMWEKFYFLMGRTEKYSLIKNMKKH